MDSGTSGRNMRHLIEMFETRTCQSDEEEGAVNDILFQANEIREELQGSLQTVLICLWYQHFV